jgi:excisionase family DNA binding protein
VPNYITTSRVAQILDVSEATVRVMERRGDLSAERTDRGTRLFDREAVEQVARERSERQHNNAEAHA